MAIASAFLQTSELSAQLQKNRLIILRGGEFCNFAASNQYNLCYEKIFTFDGCYLCSYFYGM